MRDGHWEPGSGVVDVLGRIDLPKRWNRHALRRHEATRMLAQALSASLICCCSTSHQSSRHRVDRLAREFCAACAAGLVRDPRSSLTARIGYAHRGDRRGQVTSWRGDYDNLPASAKSACMEAQANALFDRRLAEEEVWIRQGIKARRTRNEGRVRALEAMRREREQRRKVTRTVGWRSPNLRPRARRDRDPRPVVCDRWASLVSKPRAGHPARRSHRLLGPMASARPPLIRLLLGDLAPMQGR